MFKDHARFEVLLFCYARLMQKYGKHQSALPSLLNRVLGVLACFACLRSCVLTCLACLGAWRVSVFSVLVCLRVSCACVLACLVRFCTHVLNLRACYDACLACSALAYERFCLIIVFTIKGKVLQLKESC